VNAPFRGPLTVKPWGEARKKKGRKGKLRVDERIMLTTRRHVKQKEYIFQRKSWEVNKRCSKGRVDDRTGGGESQKKTITCPNITFEEP